MKVKNAAEFCKGCWRNYFLEGRERVGVVTMTKKVVSFLGENRVTPSVTAPGDANPSDATARRIAFCAWFFIVCVNCVNYFKRIITKCNNCKTIFDVNRLRHTVGLRYPIYNRSLFIWPKCLNPASI